MENPQRDLVLDLKNLKSFSKKAFRDSYMSGRVRTSIALQIRGLREQLGLDQEAFAKKIGKQQSVVSRLENTGYGQVSVRTLLEIAEALDISIVVKFASFDEFLRQHDRVTPSALAVETYNKTIGRITDLVMSGSVPSDAALQLAEGASDKSNVVQLYPSVVTGSTSTSIYYAVN